MLVKTSECNTFWGSKGEGDARYSNLGVTKFCSCYSPDNLRRATETSFCLSFINLYNRAGISSCLLRVVLD